MRCFVPLQFENWYRRWLLRRDRGDDTGSCDAGGGLPFELCLRQGAARRRPESQPPGLSEDPGRRAATPKRDVRGPLELVPSLSLSLSSGRPERTLAAVRSLPPTRPRLPPALSVRVMSFFRLGVCSPRPSSDVPCLGTAAKHLPPSREPGCVPAGWEQSGVPRGRAAAASSGGVLAPVPATTSSEPRLGLSEGKRCAPRLNGLCPQQEAGRRPADRVCGRGGARPAAGGRPGRDLRLLCFRLRGALSEGAMTAPRSSAVSPPSVTAPVSLPAEHSLTALCGVFASRPDVRGRG